MKSGIVLAVLGVVVCTGCARQSSSDTYSSAHVGESTQSYPGVIISARMVTVEDSASITQNPIGSIAGGVVGAYAGSHVGKGKGQTLATVGGAVGGAVAGAHAEKGLKTRDAVEYVVALENGDSMTVIQDPKPLFNVGQKVWFITGQQGRARVIPRQE